jgi:hypothetical protein
MFTFRHISFLCNRHIQVPFLDLATLRKYARHTHVVPDRRTYGQTDREVCIRVRNFERDVAASFTAVFAFQMSIDWPPGRPVSGC